MSFNQSGRIFHLAADRLTLRRCSQDSSVVYDDADASLRQVSAVTGELLDLLGQGPGSVEQLAAALLGDVPEVEDLALVERTLGDFVDLGWVHGGVA
jgi:hypothetical protein